MDVSRLIYLVLPPRIAYCGVGSTPGAASFPTDAFSRYIECFVEQQVKVAAAAN